jgi:DNA-binding response OmpR family regulator
VLVVEDEPLIAMLVTDYLRDLGCACIGPYARLSEALQAAKTAPVDAAILNLVLQGQHAYEVAEVLAKREIPFVFATGMPHGGIDGAWADRPFMTKPYTQDDVRTLLLQLFDQKQPTDGAPKATERPTTLMSPPPIPSDSASSSTDKDTSRR